MLNIKRGATLDTTMFPSNFSELTTTALVTATPKEKTEIHYELGLYYWTVESNIAKALEYFWLVLKQGSDGELQVDAARQIEDISIQRVRRKIAIMFNGEEKKVRPKVVKALKKLPPPLVYTVADVRFFMTDCEFTLSKVYALFACYPCPEKEQTFAFKEEVAYAIRTATNLMHQLEQSGIEPSLIKSFHKLYAALNKALELFFDGE